MKKTLLVLTTLAGVAFAAESAKFTTTNVIDSATGGFEAKGFIIDFDGTALTTTASPTDALMKGIVNLESITLSTGSASGWAKDGCFSLVITDTNFSIIGWSTSVSTANTNDYTWKFTSGSNGESVTLDTSKNYLVLADSSTSFTAGSALIKNNKMMRFGSTGVMNYGAEKVDFDGSSTGSYSGLQFISVADPGDNNAYASYTVGGTDPFNQYAPNISITTSKVMAVPEPATATLSLLALAGLVLFMTVPPLSS